MPGSNAWTVANGGTLTVTLVNLSATDPDTPLGSLVFTIGGASHGQFELAANPGIAITTFTQEQIANGDVRFVHDGSGAPPTFTVSVSDRTSGVGPYGANVFFIGGAGGTVTQPAVGDGSGSASPVITPPPVALSTAATTAPSAPGVTAFIRGPTSPPVDGGEAGAEAALIRALRTPG